MCGNVYYNVANMVDGSKSGKGKVGFEFLGFFYQFSAVLKIGRVFVSADTKIKAEKKDFHLTFGDTEIEGVVKLGRKYHQLKRNEKYR